MSERVKELECLYEVSRVLGHSGIEFDQMLQKIVDILPLGFQYPQRAGARIRLGSLCRQTRVFPTGRFTLSASMGAAAGEPGTVEVAYSDEIEVDNPSPFLPEEGQLLGKVAAEISLAAGKIRAARDNTLLEGQLRHADRLATIGVLAAGIAHELNEPLSRILGFAQLVQKETALPPGTARDVSRIVDASLHAREIVRKLLAFGHGAPAHVKECEANEIAASVMDFLDARCRSAGIEVRRELAREKLAVRADPTELQQVIVNLALNALQAMHAGGRLTVRVEETEGFCALTVEDTGVGMTPEVMDRIFIPFFTTKDEGRGTGLGLPVVHGIVTSRGGTIAVNSRVGAGSRFVVRLPIAAPAPGGGASR